jgi:hypothetical protein
MAEMAEKHDATWQRSMYATLVCHVAEKEEG